MTEGNRKNPYKCHACRGKGYGGQRCGTPTYQETVERNKRGGNAGRIAKGIVSAAITLHGATVQPQQDSNTTQHNWSNTTARAAEEGTRQARNARGGTRDKGARNRDTNRQD